MSRTHQLNRGATAADLRSIVRPENGGEAVESAKEHLREIRGEDYGNEELRSEHLQIE